MVFVLHACISSLLIAGGVSDSTYIGLPMHFVSNEGQWAREVRYALIGPRSAIWFRDNEIVVHSATEPARIVPWENPNMATGGDTETEIVRLSFAQGAGRCRVTAMDTLEGRDNFYIGKDSLTWKTGVLTHRTLRYEKVAPGVDLEIALIESIDSDAGNRNGESAIIVRTLRRTTGDTIRAVLPVTIATRGEQHLSYLDCAEIHSYLAVVGYSYSTDYSQIMTEGDYGYINGWTTSLTYPVVNAYQSTMKGDQDQVYIKYDIQNRQVIYSTYLGTEQLATVAPGVVDVSANQWRAVDNGKLYVATLTYAGFPLARTSEGSCATTGDPDTRTVVFVLDESGGLLSSLYYGGPGTLGPVDVRVHGGKVYVYSILSLDTLCQITNDAVEPRTAVLESSSGNICGHLAVFDTALDGLMYSSYIDPATSEGVWYGCEFTTMVVGDDGAVYIVRDKGVAERTKGVLVNEVMGREDIRERGAYIMALSPDLQSYKYATWFGFEDRLYTYQNSLVNADGELFLAGKSGCEPERQADPPQAFVRRYPVASGCLTGIVVSKFNPGGALAATTEICSNVYRYRNTGLMRSMCKGIIWTGTGSRELYPSQLQFAFLNAFDTTSILDTTPNKADNIILELDEDDLTLRYCSYWHHRHATHRYDVYTRVASRPNGWVYYTTHPHARSIPLQPDWYMLSTRHELGFYAADVRIPTPCWTVTCDLLTIDTIYVERRRGYVKPAEFDVSFLVSNTSALKHARLLRSWISYSDGLELVAGLDTQAVHPAEIAPGQSAQSSWRLRVIDPSVLGDTAIIRCRAMYVDPESGSEYPAPEVYCSKNVLVVPYDEPDPRVECDIQGPDTLYWTGTGLASSPGGTPSSMHYTFTLRNAESTAVEFASLRFHTGECCHVLGDSVRATIEIAPGQSVVFPVELAVDALKYDRMIFLELEARDRFDLAIHTCRMEVFVPGALDLGCSVSGETRILWYRAGGVADPSTVTMNLRLVNPLDTVRLDMSAWANLDMAPHLRIASGDSLDRGPFGVTTTGVKALTWRFTLDIPPTITTSDTLRFMYEHDGMVSQCTHVLEIQVIDATVQCHLTLEDSLREQDLLSLVHARVRYGLSNLGTVPVTVDHYALEIAPGTGSVQPGLLSLDPLVRGGGTIDPGKDVLLEWNLRPLLMHDARVALCTVLAYDSNDSILSVCTREIYLEGIESPLCRLRVVDTVRFHREVVRYEPDTVTVHLILENLLDTEETNIESAIDLTQAPRLVLVPSESASKSIAMIDSHATASLTWKLLPQPAPVAEDQQVTVRYRSDQMSGWKECSEVIHIEAWPEERGITCETGGHDSLFADWHEERFIPDPLHLSYTVTNTGTVALTGSEASIILPSAFSLAGSDSTQSFTSPEYANQPGGPVPEGTLLPGASCSRWWKITPAQNIADNDPRPITWIWKSNEQGTESGCTHIVYIIPDNPPGLVLTPLHLYFEAERGGALPVEQQVQLWTGGGLSMPWRAQPSEWWLDAKPTSGSQSTQISVQPNSTLLDVGAHGADLLFAATPTDRHVAITYVIRKSTGIESPAAPGVLTLDAWPQPVAAGALLYIRLGEEAGGSCRLTLHDLLGRERLTRHAETASPVVVDLGALQLPTGVYLLRAIAGDGAQATRMISITGGR